MIAPTRPLPSRRGYSLLVIMVVIAAATLLVLMTISLGGSEVRQRDLDDRDAVALSLAELGLERTKAYLGRILDTDGDFDRALDPAMDDDCAWSPGFGVTTTGVDAEDHLPAFTDGTAVQFPGWTGAPKGKYLLVPWPGTGAPRGAYLVRIDDNDDEMGWGLAQATATNPLGSAACLEGPTVRHNPARDRDRMVMVTVVGIAPGLDPATAQSRKVLRSLVGPGQMPGILAGGPVESTGSSKICGPFGDLAASGDVDLEEMCASNCAGSCSGAPGALTAQTSGATCNRDDLGPCDAQQDPPAVPNVDPLDARWRPGPCPTATTCTPFYRVSNDSLPARVEMWNYAVAGCADPRTESQACLSAGTCTASCWLDVSGAVVETVGLAAVIHVKDDPALQLATPAPLDVRAVAGTPYHTFRTASASSSTCAPLPTVPGIHFTYEPRSPVPKLPRGVWLFVGHVTLNSSPGSMPDCTVPSSAALLVLGSLEVANGDYFLVPPGTLQAAVVVGGDLEFQTGNCTLSTCTSGAAILAREQAAGRGNNTLRAPLIVQNAPDCQGLVSSTDAIDFGGNFTMEVPAPPLFSTSPASYLSWTESTL